MSDAAELAPDPIDTDLFAYSEWLDEQGLIVSDSEEDVDPRSHEQLVIDFLASRATTTTDLRAWANSPDRMAEEWHAESDHCRDGVPFGAPLCNCDRIAARARSLGWAYDGPRIPRRNTKDRGDQ